jgi:hypothetical protein
MSHAMQQISSNLRSISGNTPVRREELALYQTQPITTPRAIAMWLRVAAANLQACNCLRVVDMLLEPHMWLSSHAMVHTVLQSEGITAGRSLAGSHLHLIS